MPPAADDASSIDSSVALLSRRRGSLASGNGDIEQGGGASSGGGETINIRIKTSGDGREYKVSTTLSDTIVQVSMLLLCCFLSVDGPVSK